MAFTQVKSNSRTRREPRFCLNLIKVPIKQFLERVVGKWQLKPPQEMA
jgi:hypothetical protein